MISAPEVLVERARATAGLVDLGPDGWQDGFERLVDAVATEVGDDPEAVDWIEGELVARLVRRLRVEGWYADHPGQETAPVEGPLVIIGLPRTATTAMHYILALDDRLRYLRNWEARDLVPPPVAGEEEDDPRRRRVERDPNVHHIYTVDGPSEDGTLHELSFHHGEMVLPVPNYTKWWRETGHGAAFAYHERVLRLLHAHRPPHRWLLKNPAYVFQLRDLAAQYPGARFVVTHRDPLEVMPSTCSVVVSSRRRRLAHWQTDQRALGPELQSHFAGGMERFIADRDALGEHRFVDVGQREVQRDPIGVARRIYDFAGLDLDAGRLQEIEAWAAGNGPGARGSHQYRAEDFALTPAGIRDAFGAYLDRFGDWCA